MAGSILSKLITRGLMLYESRSPVIFRLVYPNGDREQNREGVPHIIITTKSWWSFARCAFFGSYGFARDYVAGHIDVEGDLRYLGYLVYLPTRESGLGKAIRRGIRPDTPFVTLLNRLHMLRHLAWSYASAQYNAEYHYGHDPEFYFNYLGPTGAYSTGFWYPETKNVEEAQDNKWELILKKLRLAPGMRVCSVGTGFGYGEMLAAQKYGVIVDCYNTCRPQNAWLRKEVIRRGLEGRVNVYDADYREVAKKKGEYDRLLVIECIEHSGDLFRKKTIAGFAECLKDDGIGVMQWLSFDIPSDVALFIREYLYPGVTMPPLGGVLDELALGGFEVLDVLCNRRHYYYTLNAWTDNFIKNWSTIQAINPARYTESFRRKWLLYLAAGAYYLVTPNATARLYQVTFSKGDTVSYPMNREFLYDDDADESAWVKSPEWVIIDDRGTPVMSEIKPIVRME